MKNLVELKNCATFGSQMKKISKQILLLALFLSTTFLGMAQSPPSEDFMRSMGKMYVVIAAVGIIFLGIILFLIYLERKLTRLENQNQ